MGTFRGLHFLTTYISSSRSPRHKDSLHLTILPWLEVALLRGDVLHKLASLVAANLDRCVIFTCLQLLKIVFVCGESHLFGVLEDTVGRGANVPWYLRYNSWKTSSQVRPIARIWKNDPGAHSILFVIRTVITHLPAGSFRIHLLHSFFLEGALEV